MIASKSNPDRCRVKEGFSIHGSSVPDIAALGICNGENVCRNIIERLLQAFPSSLSPFPS